MDSEQPTTPHGFEPAIRAIGALHERPLDGRVVPRIARDDGAALRFRVPRSGPTTMRSLLLLSTAALLLGCGNAGSTPPSAASTQPAGARASSASSSVAQAEIGKPAPDFTLTDYEGKAVHLADLRGKTVVLEWFNPDCPFVKSSHNKGSLKDAARRNTAKGVVWLGVNSAASGKQGFGPERVAEGKKAFGLEHPILADTEGRVGKLYGATNTPHLYVIDAKGTLVYKGAIDNSPDGEGDSPTGGTLINYVDAALDDLAAGRPVATPATKAYGCSVKYGS